MAIREGSFAIAYTYSEPLIHAEYILDTARLAHNAGLMNVLVSNGYLNPSPAEEVLGLMDAANIDLKSFDEQFYRVETGGSLAEVKRFLKQAAGHVHLEVTTLVIPTKNDDTAQVEGISRFIASLGDNIPLHLSAYHPDYKYSIPATAGPRLRELAEVARKFLRFVYIGNLMRDDCDTTCPGCGNLLVQRHGYAVKIVGISRGACSACGAAVPIVSGG
jgi:pyruvate formate lyase activating enzyme